MSLWPNTSRQTDACVCGIKGLTLQLAAQQLQAEAHALVGGSLRVDPDEAGKKRTQ